MQKGGEGVQIACKIVYVINGRPHVTVVKPHKSAYQGLKRTFSFLRP